MSDSPLEELENREHMEHAEHAAHGGSKLLAWVSLTIAVLAVLSALVGSLETMASGSAVGQKNEAVLAQNRASDQWNFYEAKSLKKNLYAIAAGEGGANAAKYAAIAKSDGADEDGIQAEAKKFEAERDAHLKASEAAEDRHHTLTIAATLMHMGIAISTVAIITGKRWPWLASLALGGVGTLAAVLAYL
ncbi:MAG TPA: DUF4337 domain-containing protein [Caulobacteraceae bacterium]|nr:DUF4337 domain-containing protein [Caulobacteraceae bacterium]